MAGANFLAVKSPDAPKITKMVGGVIEESEPLIDCVVDLIICPVK